MKKPVARRDLLKGLGISGVAIGTASIVNIGQTGPALGTTGHSGPITADWVKRENEYPGDFTWLKGPTTNSYNLCGYANSTSYAIGEIATFHFSATTPFITAKLYRLGYYGGAGARLVHLFKNVPVQSQPVPSPDSYGTVDCNWPTSLTVPIDGTFLPGQYLIKLVDDLGQYQFVPFMIRSHRSTATYLYMSSVTTWQAYNTFGGASLYRDDMNQVAGAGGRRAVRVSYNRPYVTAHGSADLLGLEFPLLFLCERDGLDVAYCTSIDVHSGKIQLTDHRTLLSLGHDEYYSKEMRAAVISAISARTNIAFLGSNYIYRRVRFEPDANGVPNRFMINYRTLDDPAAISNPSLTTMNWQLNPYAAAPSLISGANYGGIDGSGSLHVQNANGWLWKDTGLRSGALLPRALYGEFNSYSRNDPQPPGVKVLAHSRVAEGYSDITYVHEQNRGQVFAANMGSWIPNLTNLIPVRFNRHVPIDLSTVFEAATRNVLTRLV